MKTKILSLYLILSCFILPSKGANLLVEAEEFAHKGGWVLDQQSMNQMGSPYLLAHGLGYPVADAYTNIKFPKTGTYYVYVRTYNWTSPWYKGEGAGKFSLLLNNRTLAPSLGVTGTEWEWQSAGKVHVDDVNAELRLRDLTGFNGRCDAIFFTTNPKQIPPKDVKELTSFRKKVKGMPSRPQLVGKYDLVVVGGGIAGCCTAVAAARLGCKVALLQNRPVLGGNNSSEVRVGLSGLVAQKPYPQLGNLVDELGGVGYWTIYEAKKDPTSLRSKQIMQIVKQHPEKKKHNAGPATNYEDKKKYDLVNNQENLDLFLNTHVYDLKKKGNKIVAVIAKDIETGEEKMFKASFFADCTGDGDIGYLAGADFRMGREAKSFTDEPSAPEKEDQLVMGTSVQWYANDQTTASGFPACPWAIQFNEQTCIPISRGDWNWEAGLNNNQITDIEYIRDHALRAVFGNWDYLKNHSTKKEKFANKKLEWVAYIGGKRESRRLLGDVILREQDLLEGVDYEDATFTTTWEIDLHYPKAIKGMKEEPFLSWCKPVKIKPYAVPYRCLYSRNVDNLFMAGRNISVTHIALGTIRVMRTGGMMGEVVGMAASICKKHNATPRGVYQNHLPELKELMEKGVGKAGFPEAVVIK